MRRADRGTHCHCLRPLALPAAAGIIGMLRGVSVMADAAGFEKHVRTSLRRFADQQRNRFEAMGSDVVPLVDAAAEFVIGGKLLRPLFCYAGWITAGASPQDPRIADAASAFEWLHASALAHDDVMDDSDTRRGKPSLHRQFPDHAESYGKSVAVLIGDLMLSWSDGVLRDPFAAPEDCDRLHAALEFFDAARSEVVAGQFLDLTAQTAPNGSSISVDDATRVMTFKSAKYTVERPLQAGAALAGAGAELMPALTTYAIPLGEAFQLRDDLLGVFGDPNITGKPAGDDLRDGKRTALIARAHELTDDAGRAVIDNYLGDEDGIAALLEVIEASGAPSAIEDDIAVRLDATRSAIEKLPAAGHGLLSELLDRAANRRS